MWSFDYEFMLQLLVENNILFELKAVRTLNSKFSGGCARTGDNKNKI